MKTYRYHVAYFFNKKEYSEEFKRDLTNTGYGSAIITGNKLDSSFMDGAINLLKEQNGFDGIVIMNVIKLEEVKQ